MDLEPATFLIREERLDLRALFIVLHRRVQIIQIGDEIDRLLERQFPDREDADRAILLGGHPRGRDGEELTARWPQVADVKVDAKGAHPNGRCGATDVVPAVGAEVGLHIDPIKLAMAQEGHLGVLRHDRLHLREQRTMGFLRKMPLRGADHHPAERQGPPVIDHTQHQRQAAATGDTPIHHERDRLRRQGGSSSAATGRIQPSMV
ncbi:MAG: hypothetical protein M3R61_02125 [Chloroflexota bacterium]|nr:hypothetical protein [Chloroflexota bacterium]